LFSNGFERYLVKLEVFLVDDGGIDGTALAVLDEFPSVNILFGDGKLYWNGGMRYAFKTAMCHDFDYYLWINDDTILFPEAISDLLDLFCHFNCGIAVGSCKDPSSGKWTYGGRSLPLGKRSISGMPVIPNGSIQHCHLVNGNIVLISRAVVAGIGNLSDSFTHAMGDFDYGLRALAAGFSILISGGYQGLCQGNGLPEWCDPGVSLRRRILSFYDPKGICFPEFFKFCRRHVGYRSYIICVKVILRLLAPKVWLKLKKEVNCEGANSHNNL
jgi:glycosyltransferase involved in cell wall biosynthesis